MSSPGRGAEASPEWPQAGIEIRSRWSRRSRRRSSPHPNGRRLGLELTTGACSSNAAAVPHPNGRRKLRRCRPSRKDIDRASPEWPQVGVETSSTGSPGALPRASVEWPQAGQDASREWPQGGIETPGSSGCRREPSAVWPHPNSHRLGLKLALLDRKLAGLGRASHEAPSTSVQAAANNQAADELQGIVRAAGVTSSVP